MSSAPRAMSLSELVGHPRLAPGGPGPDPLIRGLAYDSRKVEPGDLFVCPRGARDDGHRHATDAARRGAVAILGERPVEGLDGLSQITVADSRAELARLAARFYGAPSACLNLTGVTGIEGKTTTVYLIDAILRGAGHATGMFGTIVNRVGRRTEAAALTTPESLELQRLLGDCVRAGVTHVVMEVSSHALAQGRVVGCEFDQAVFTHLHSDHLDFQGPSSGIGPRRRRCSRAWGAARPRPGSGSASSTPTIRSPITCAWSARARSCGSG